MTSSVPPPSPPPLSADELEKVAALRSAVGTQPVGDAAAWLDDACLCRYLRARGWDVAKAEAMLREALAWRARSGVANLRWQDVAAESGTGKIQRLAHRDKAGRPILVLRPGRENTKGQAGQMRFLAWNLEASVRSMQPGHHPRGGAADLAPEQHTVVIDFTDYSLFNAPPRSTTLETLNILQVQFPERLGCAVLLSPPSIFQLCWALVSPFLDRRTKEKIHFVARPESGHGRAMLDALFDAAVVDTSLGAFKPAEYSAWAAAQEAAWLAARGRGGHAHHGGHGHHGHTNGHRDGLHAGGEGAEVWHDAVESHEP